MELEGSTQTQHAPASDNQMPQWSRIGQLDRSRYPKPFSKDSSGCVIIAADSLSSNVDDDGEQDQGLMQTTNEVDITAATRVDYLEKSIKFLKTQHAEVLHSLHSEIDKLRKENKDLHFQLVMMNRKSPSQLVPDTLQTTNYTNGDTNWKSPIADGNASLEQQVKDLKQQVKRLEHENSKLISQPTGAKSKRSASHRQTSSKTKLKSASSTVEHKNEISNDNVNQAAEILEESGEAHELVLNLSALPDLPTTARRPTIAVKDGEAMTKRAATTEDFERIIVHLLATSRNLNEELMSIKLDLREVLYTHKWTPEAFLLAKGYITSDSSVKAPVMAAALSGGVAGLELGNGESAIDNLLDITQRGSGLRKLPSIGVISTNGVSSRRHVDQITLPALKNTVGTKAAERRKRTQILQKARLGQKPVL